MRCEEVRPLLQELADGEIRVAGPLEGHLASCSACSAELRRYRSLVLQLGALRGDLVEPPEGFLEDVLALAPGSRWRILTRRVILDERVQVAAASVGGLLVVAAAVGLLRRRAGRRLPVPVATSSAA